MEGSSYHHKWPLSALFPAPRLEPRANPIPALIRRCDTMKRFQGRFHAPMQSITPRGDPARVLMLSPLALFITNQISRISQQIIRSEHMAECLFCKLTRGNGQRPGPTSQIKSHEHAAKKRITRAAFPSAAWDESDSDLRDYSGL